jgi:hypothetical protein
MPLSHHDDLEFVAGDDWTIDGLLLDVDGSSLDVTNASFQWTLIDPTGMSVADLGNGSAIIVVSAINGQVQVVVPAALTETLLAGRYHDALRVTIDSTSTFWLGTILVDGDPFSLIPTFIPQPDFASIGLAVGAASLDKPTITVH